MRMNPNEIGKKLGIGIRVAGRIAQQRAQQAGNGQAQPQNPADSTSAAQQTAQSASQPSRMPSPAANYGARGREIGKSTHRFTRAAGRGVGGFLRPFGRVGGILWLEVTGFFFGLFGLYFAVDMWRTRLSYAAGPQHGRFLIAAGLVLVFGYLSVSAFWRAKRK
jgi:hypothetical protein